MIRTSSSSGSQMVYHRFFTLLSRPNEILLIPWRLLATCGELCALICLANAGYDVMVVPYYGTGLSDPVVIAAKASFEASVAITIITTLLSGLFFVSARLINDEALNLVQCCRHTLSGFLNLGTWYYLWHPIRVWHIFVWVTIVPFLIELVLVLRSIRSGRYIWQ